MRYLDTAENQLSIGNQAVDIEALADPVTSAQNPISFCSQRLR